MARQSSRSKAFDSFYSSYNASVERREQELARHRARAEAIAEAMREDGVEVTDADVEDITRQLADTGDFSFTPRQQRVAPVEESVPTSIEQAVVEPMNVPERSSALDIARATVGAASLLSPTTAPGIVGSWLNRANTEDARQYGAATFESAWATGQAQALAAEREGMSFTRDAPGLQALIDVVSGPLKSVSRLEEMFMPEEVLAQRRLQEEQEQRARAQAAAERAQTLEERLGGQYSPTATLVRGAASLAAQPEMLLPPIGGLAGGAITRTPSGAAVASGLASLPMANRAYNAAIDEASEWPGITDDERHEYGMMIVAAELGPDVALGIFGAGLAGLFRKYGPSSLAKDAISEAVRNRASLRIGAAVAGGAVSENIAEDAGLAVRSYLADSDRIESEEARAAIGEQVAEERAEGWRRRIDPTVAGGLMGGGIATPIAGGAYVRKLQHADRTAATLENILSAEGDTASALVEAFNAGVMEQQANVAEGATETSPAEDSAITEISPEQKAAEEDAAWEQRRQERSRQETYEATRKNFEDAVDLARDDVEVLQEAVEDGARDSQTLNDLAAANARLRDAENALANFDATRPVPTTQEQMTPVPQPEPEPAPVVPEPTPEQLEAERLERVAQGERIERIRKAQEARKKKQAKEEERARKKQEAEAKKREDAIISELIEQNPDATPAELEVQLRERLAAPEGQAPQPVQEAPVEAPAQPQEQQQAVTEDTVVEQPAVEAEQAAPTIETDDNQITDEKVESLVNFLQSQAGETLGMAETEGTALEPDFDTEGWREFSRRFASSLANSSAPGSRGTQELILQGRLRIIPSARYTERQTTNVAEYDTATGEMRIYADRLENPDNAVAAIIAAAHEAAHDVTFRDREGRTTLMQRFANSAPDIRRAAERGNRLAQEAVRLAEADTAARRERGEQNPDRNEDAEVVGYFAGEVARDRSRPLGSVRSIVGDLTTAARQLVREVTPLDLEVSIGDLTTAAQYTAMESAQQGAEAPTGDGSILAMIYNVDESEPTPGQLEAIANGWVYESVDGNRKYVLSDADAEVTGADQLLSATDSVPMRDILNHEVLYAEMPSARDIPVHAVDKVLGNDNAFGAYSPNADGSGDIYVRRDIVDGTNPSPNAPTLKELLMHEIQHYVQDQGGYSDEFYDPRPGAKQLREAKAKYTRAKMEVIRASSGFASRVMETLTEDGDRAAVMRAYMQPSSSPLESAARVMETVLGLENIPDATQAAIDRFNSDIRTFEQAQLDWAAAREAEHARYQRNITEREAFFTQYNADNEVITGINPEETTMRTQEADPETGYDPTEGAIDVPVQGEDGPGVIPMSVGETLGMASVDAGIEAHDTPTSQAFRDWFGDSVIKDSKGRPQIYYHGSKQNFDTFRLNDLGLIFASPNETFAEAFAGINELSLEQNPAIPLYVRAENPWDYENPQHVEALLDYEIPDVRYNTVREFVENYYNMLSPEEAVNKLRQGDWSVLETPEVIEAIKDLGHDGVFLQEATHKNIAVFSPNQFKHATENQGTWSREDDNILAAREVAGKRVTARAIDALVPNNAFGDWVKPRAHITRAMVTGLLRNDRGLGNAVLQAFEYSKSTPAADEARANAYLGKYEDAIADLAREQNTTVDALNNQIRDELDAIDNADNTYSQNRAAWKNVLDKYGEAGQYLMKMRDEVDSLSFEMLRQLQDSNVRIAPATAKQYAAIAANLGRYTHRLYGAHMGKAGKKYARTLMRAYDTLKRNPDAELTEREQQAASVVNNAIKVLIDDYLVIPEDEVLYGMDKESVSRLHSTWVGSPEGSVDLLTMQEELAARRDSITPEMLTREAEQTARDLLGLLNEAGTTVVGRYFRGGKQDLGILQERKRIPTELRMLMGEVTDPGTRMLATVAKQAEFIARTRLHEELKQVAMPRDLQPPDSAGSQIVSDNEMTVLEGPGYGTLQGWYASPNMRMLLDDTRESLMSMEQAATIASTNPNALPEAVWRKVIQGYTGVASTSKGLQIVGNAFLYPLNALGSASMIIASGNYSPSAIAQGAKDAMALIAYAHNPRRGLGSADLAVRYGVTDSATVGEFRGIPYRKLQESVREMAGEGNIVQWLKRQYAKGSMTLPEIYAMTDVWTKIANFHNEAAVLRDFYEKEGIQRSDDEIYREAAEKTKRTNISWSRAMPLMKALERGGVTHFGVYFYEVFRTEMYNAAEGLKELKRASEARTPEARNVMLSRGLKRLAGQAAVWGMWGLITQQLNSLIFGDDDEEAWLRRALFPDYMQNQDLYPMGLGENGLPVFFGLSRLDPKGPITDIMRQAIVGEFDYDEAKQTLYDLYVQPRVAPRLIEAVKATASDEPVYREPLFKQLTPKGYGVVARGTRALGIEDNTLQAYTNAFEGAFLPGTFNAYRDTNPRIVGPDESLGDFAGAVASMASMARWMGATFVQAQPDRNMQFAFRDYSKQLTHNRTAIRQFFNTTPDATPAEASRRILDLVAQERDEWNKLHRIYLGMEASGMKAADIDTIMKDRISDKRVRSQLYNGRFEPLSVSERSIKTTMQNEMKGKSKEEKDEIRDKWEAVLTTLRAVKGEL